MKKQWMLSVIGAMVLAGCGNLQEELTADLTSEYIFYEHTDGERPLGESFTIAYTIGDVVTELPTERMEQQAHGAGSHVGYYIDDWQYYGNPIADTTTVPDNFVVNENTTAIEGFLVTPQPAWLVVSDWLPIQYTVILDGNGGAFTDKAGETQTQYTMDNFVYDEEQPLWKNQFKRNGYIYNGWNVAENRGTTAKDYEDEEAVKNLTTTRDGTVTLYACWLKDKITITFDAGEGTGTMDAIRVEVDDVISLSTLTAPEGKYFTGWYCTFADGSLLTESDGTTPRLFADGEVLTEENYPNESCTFVAQWQWISYTVTFDAVEGAFVDEWDTQSQQISQPINWGTTLSLPDAPWRHGYDFAGWYVDAERETPFDSTTLIKQDYTLYAKWTAQTYTVTFDANGGTGTMDAQTFTFDEPQALPKNTFTKEGFNFEGWGFSENDGAVYRDEETVNIADSITLYAVWGARGSVSDKSAGFTVVETSEGLVFTAPGGSSFQWLLDGTMQSQTDQTYTVRYDAGYDDGNLHLIVVLVYDDYGIPAVYSAKFTVQ